MLKISEIRALSEGEREAKILELQDEIFKLRSQQLDSKSQKTHLVGEKRKTIARLKTVAGEKRA